jgi:hypothetical protein
MEKENLKEYVQKFFEIEKEEEKYKDILSKIKKQKDILNENIINFMDKNNIKDKDIIFGDKKIKYAATKVQASITKKLIYDRLTIFLKNEEIANNATNFIYSDRDNSLKYSLKISDIKK